MEVFYIGKNIVSIQYCLRIIYWWQKKAVNVL